MRLGWLDKCPSQLDLCLPFLNPVRIRPIRLFARLHDDSQCFPVLRRVRMPEAKLDCFVDNAAATNNVPRDTNFVDGTTPMRFHNDAIVNDRTAISKIGVRDGQVLRSAAYPRGRLSGRS